jgi:hypothetical protein
VEDSIRPFRGNDEYPVEKWIQDFEDTSVLLRWSRLQKFIFAKKSLKGLAKLYIQREYGTSTYYFSSLKLLPRHIALHRLYRLHHHLYHLRRLHLLHFSPTC